MNDASPPAHAAGASELLSPRVFSLVGAATDWLAAFGAAERVVGRRGAQIEDVVSLAPDLVIVSSEEEARAIGVHVPGAETFVFAPRTFKEVLDRALALGRAAGAVRESMAYIADAEHRLAMAQRKAGISKRSVARPGVVILHGRDLLYSGGFWCADLIDLAGGKLMFTNAGAPPTRVSLDGVRNARPDLVLLVPPLDVAPEGRFGSDAQVRQLPPKLALLDPGPGLYWTVEVLIAMVARA